MQKILGYTSINVMHNYEFILSQRYVLDDPTLVNDIRTADIIVYQPLDNKYGKNSSDAILSEARPGCQFISLPYVFNHGFWPMLYISKGDISDDPEAYEINAPMYINLEPVHSLVKQGCTIDEILDQFESDQINFKHLERFQHCLEYLREKESICDVRISDFISKNYQNLKLFYHPSHPTLPLLMEMAGQIIEVIGCKTNANPFNENDLWMPTAAVPYWQGSVDRLGLPCAADESAVDYYKDIIRQYVKGVCA